MPHIFADISKATFVHNPGGPVLRSATSQSISSFQLQSQPIFFDNSLFFYGSLLEPLHSFIAEIPVHPQVLVYLFRPGTSGKERNSELTNITEPIISKHFCQREVGLPKVQDSGRGPSFVFCPIGRTTDGILELPF